LLRLLRLLRRSALRLRAALRRLRRGLDERDADQHQDEHDSHGDYLKLAGCFFRHSS
jgi:hypothetical protein